MLNRGHGGSLEWFLGGNGTGWEMNGNCRCFPSSES